MWEFDVFTSGHDYVKYGLLEQYWSRVLISKEEFPVFEHAYEVAANLAVAVHGGMPTKVLVRY